MFSGRVMKTLRIKTLFWVLIIAILTAAGYTLTPEPKPLQANFCSCTWVAYGISLAAITSKSFLGIEAGRIANFTGEGQFALQSGGESIQKHVEFRV